MRKRLKKKLAKKEEKFAEKLALAKRIMLMSWAEKADIMSRLTIWTKNKRKARSIKREMFMQCIDESEERGLFR